MATLDDIITQAFGEPTPKQDEFYYAKTRHVGYGGARGGGKSHGVRGKATLLGYEYPNIKMLIVRRTFPELRRNYTRPLQDAYARFPEYCRPIYSESEKAFTFPKGGTLELGYCDTDADVAGYIGNEWDVVFLDEATQLTEYQAGALNSCVRGVNRLPKRTYYTCNPGGIGHTWVKRLFIDKDYHRGEHAKDYTFIPARVWDNIPMLMADNGFANEIQRRKIKKVTPELAHELMYYSDYVRALDSLPDDIREAWLNGDWNIFAGQYFSEWDKRVHVIEPFEIPERWRRTTAFDYGLDRFAVLWFAVDEYGNEYCYRNYEETNLTISGAVSIYKELSATEKIEEVTAPPDMWNRRQDSGKSVANEFAENGIYLVPAGRERVSGWLQVKEHIRPVETTINGMKKTTSRLRFFDTCKWINEYMPQLQYDIKKPSDVDTEPHKITHSPDALRAWCSRRQAVAEIEIQPKIYNFEIEKPKEEGWGEVTEDYLTEGY